MNAPVALQTYLEIQAVRRPGQERLVWIGHQQDQICLLKKFRLVANGVRFESRTLPNSSGVYQPNHQTIGEPSLFQMISGCSGNIINKGELLICQCVEEGAFPCVRWPKDSHRGGGQQDIKSS